VNKQGIVKAAGRTRGRTFLIKMELRATQALAIMPHMIPVGKRTSDSKGVISGFK
jgi:hypothetical protein